MKPNHPPECHCPIGESSASPHKIISNWFKFTLPQGDRPFCCPMPNCRRRFATEQEVKKHIDNHMNPHASKSRRSNAAAAAAAAATAASNLTSSALTGVTNNLVDGTKTPFQLAMDKQSNIIPRMGPAIKHELYFPPQCYGSPFNQAFGHQQQQQQQQALDGSVAGAVSAGAASGSVGPT